MFLCFPAELFQPGVVAEGRGFREGGGDVSDQLEGTVLDDTPLRGELYDLESDPLEWYNRFDDPACAAVRAQLTLDLIAHVSTAFAKGPAFGDYGGYGKITPA